MSQSARGSKSNTFLDDIFGTSLYDLTWNKEPVNKNFNPTIKTTTPTITQPKSQNQNSDLSDDGLINTRNNNLNKPVSPYAQNQIPVSRQMPYRPSNM